MIEDLRYALRQLRKAPAFAAAAILTLALGIGAAAAMFGLVQGVLLSPPPYADADRLVLVSPKARRPAVHAGHRDSRSGSSGGESRTLEPPALYRWTFNFLVLPDGSESLGGMVVTAELLHHPRREAAPRPRVHRAEASGRRSRRPPSFSATSSGSGNSTAIPTSSARRFAISRYPAPLTLSA